MIIDDHAHSCGEFYTAEGIKTTLNSLGVDKVVLCPCGVDRENKKVSFPNYACLFPRADMAGYNNKFVSKAVKEQFDNGIIDEIFDKPNEYLIKLSQELPEMILPFYWTSPERDNVIEDLEKKFIQYPFLRGVKVHQCFLFFSLDLPKMYEIADFCGRKNLPLFVHIGTPLDADNLLKLVKAKPQTKFINGHLIGLDIIMKAGPLPENLFLDLSPYILVSKHRIMKAYKYAGASKLMMGSDTPLGNDCLKKILKRIRSLSISQADKDLILGENMRNILGL